MRRITRTSETPELCRVVIDALLLNIDACVDMLTWCTLNAKEKVDCRMSIFASRAIIARLESGRLLTPRQRQEVANVMQSVARRVH